MLAITVALVALLTPFFTQPGASKIVTGLDDFIVDLGYQLNRGHAVSNNTLVTFRNIRFAAPPLRPLRFLAPSPPPLNRSNVQNASDVICPQAFPQWWTTGAVTPFSPGDIPPVDPRTSEDCLFLDVLLPKEIWQTRQRAGAPVLVWIHGGGFDFGWKDASGQGYGLVTRSQRFGSQGVILVSINYRLGLFGWMNGVGVTSNAGLLDQRFALEWVQKYIHLFGGDASRVTILGESAGAGSVEAHITAYGGTKGSSPFRGAIAQSPYYLPTSPLPNSRVDAVLGFGNVSSIDTLREFATFGSFTFGVVPDDDYVPNLPGKLFEQGRFDNTLSVLTGHDQDEGSRFVPNKLTIDESSYATYLESLITPLTNNATALHHITQVLYPPVFDGSQGYTNQIQRNNLTIADATIVCNTRFIDQASFLPTTYAYEFSTPPAMHAAELPYTFYDFGPVPGINTTVAEILQGYITRFAEIGQPYASTLPFFPPTRPGLTVQNLGSDFVGPMLDERGINQLPERCRFWQDVPYLSIYQSDARAKV